ncbi:hypothetical protein BDZ91DRAFT_849226 [Kalaharituber pfeilii]|nr:hypothetical protein BDZ91DRAFT_849226 [Kalaharituber pfeilii]
MTRNLAFLRGDVFKIILKDGSSEPTNASQFSNDPYSRHAETKNKVEFLVHKKLLASLSPELERHTNNEMKEGREGVMELSGVHEATMEAFLEWAYYHDYTVPPSQSNLVSLMHNTKVYVLGDRFNVKKLQDLAFSRLTTALHKLGKVANARDVSSLMEVVTFAFDNLPYTTVLSGDSARSETLLEHFAQYVAWALDVIKKSKEFKELLVHCPDFATAVLNNSRCAVLPPWLRSVTPGTMDMGSDEIQICSQPNTTHILSRSCVCGYNGVMSIRCRSCNKVDHEIGTTVKIMDTEIWIIGNDRVSGTPTNYVYTCKWCKAKNGYDTACHNFYDARYFGGSSASRISHTGYLSCRSCNAEGYRKKMTTVA